jgi:tetratricopeptide (TPR) repeat protein
MTIKRHKPLLAKTEVVKHLIQDISGVEIQQMVTMEVFSDLIQNIPGMERQQRRTSDSSDMYRVCLVLKSGKRRVPLTPSFNGNLAYEHQKAEVIARFLDIRNYGLRGLLSPKTSSEELQWKTVEEKILHWETAIKSDPSDADAHIKLALALIRQGKTKNKERAMRYLKQAEAIFKSQGYDDEAKMADLLHSYVEMLVE